jgi:hypothetical protein
VSRRVPAVAVALVAIVVIGLTLIEVVPHYSVERHRHEGPGRLDLPSFLPGDCPFYRSTLLSVLKDGDLDVRNNLADSAYDGSDNVAAGRNGAWSPKHSILMPIVALPFYAVAGDFGLLAFNLLQLAALSLLLWIGARRYTFDYAALALVLWFAFGTFLRAAANNWSPDVFSTLLVMGGVVALLYGRVATAGALLAVAIWAKWTNVIFFAPTGLFLIARREWRPLLRFALAAVPPVLGILALNLFMFGSPLTTPYDRVLIERGGHMVIQESHRTFFTLPFWHGLYEQLTHKHMGLLIAAPPVVLAIPGVVLLFRRARSEAVLLAGVCVAQLCMFAKYDQWSASSYGPRFLMTVVATSALVVAPVLERVFGWRVRDTHPASTPG